ncbi:DASH family cryptochrome [Tunicatimonas pelagia]|uniref:DASH family cryptochrome n=1 Tax=Tunicatimonas pelagia TaxID=931531 RepID=UPI0026651079|nr:DASH family cryptochrome [Tunicatimonas pelagia]WKN43666.1 DASH family cryptochrome [Tunicatimonas pelagia]
MSRALVYFRNDLRLHDNPTLSAAINQADEVLLLYCVDPRQFAKLDLGFRKMGIHRARFLLESLEDLNEQCQKLGGQLLVKQGLPEDIIPQLVAQYELNEVHLQREVTEEETQVEQAVEQQLKSTDCQLCFHWGLTLYHPDDLPFEPADTPEAFKAFRNEGTKKASVRDEFPPPKTIKWVAEVEAPVIPTLPELGFTQRSGEETNYPGGESAALQRLQHYLFDSELLTRYKWTRNQSLGMDYSSKFSPWLALGCLSPRRIYYAVKHYEQEVTRNISTYWLIFEMLWRDYFKFLGLKYGSKIFWKQGIYDKGIEWNYDRSKFDLWCQGKIGIPFVDAHMQELNQTGFMSNRGRVNVSTYLTRDLEIDWRWGASYFESLLVDYDVTSNWLNWYFQAVVWRYTHILWQSTHYDPKGEYIRHWLPQLVELPEELIPIAFLLTEEEQQQHNFKLGRDYPEPLLIPKKWNRMLKRIGRQ